MRTPQTLSRTIAVACVVLVAASCGGTVASRAPSTPASPAGGPTLLWPAPANPLERTVEAGLEPAPKEFLVNHVHAHLDVFIDGDAILVPPGIGINIEDPEVEKFDLPDGTISYSGIVFCDHPCISPLHTHDESGILHTESVDPEPHTLGQFFVEWGVQLSETCVGEHCAPTPIAVYICGAPYQGDPRQIELTDQKVIVIAVGTPPAMIPSTFDFSDA